MVYNFTLLYYEFVIISLNIIYTHDSYIPKTCNHIRNYCIHLNLRNLLTDYSKLRIIMAKFIDLSPYATKI